MDRYRTILLDGENTNEFTAYIGDSRGKAYEAMNTAIATLKLCHGTASITIRDNWQIIEHWTVLDGRARPERPPSIDAKF